MVWSTVNIFLTQTSELAKNLGIVSPWETSSSPICTTKASEWGERKRKDKFSDFSLSLKWNLTCLCLIKILHAVLIKFSDTGPYCGDLLCFNLRFMKFKKYTGSILTDSFLYWMTWWFCHPCLYPELAFSNCEHSWLIPLFLSFLLMSIIVEVLFLWNGFIFSWFLLCVNCVFSFTFDHI